MPQRRDLLKTVGIAATGLLAGCPSQGSTESNTASADTDTTEQEATAGTDEGGESGVSVGPMTAVATEWNVYRARLHDAVALGRAGAPGAGATVARTFLPCSKGRRASTGPTFCRATSESANEG